MNTIVVPLDGSELAEQALPLAGTIATKRKAELVLTTAIATGDRWVDGMGRRWQAEEQAAVESYLRTIVERLKQKRVPARARVDWGRPHIVIGTVADQEDADFIVMTTHGRSGVSRWTMGSIADKVLRTTSRPLILIHATTHARVPENVQRILVPLDGSELAEAALPQAEQFARSMSASLVLVRAVVPPAILYTGEFVPGDLPDLEGLEAAANAYLDRTAEPIRERGLQVGVAVGVGVPAEVILNVCRDHGANLIVMTTHGRSGVDRWMFGSVADAVVRHVRLPVLVVPSRVKPAEEEPAGIPMAGNAVVPPPALTETEQVAPSPEMRWPKPRTRRPERSPGR